MDNSQDKLDRLIDSALAGYIDAEPLAGLEARVLNRVRVAGASCQWTFGWAAALAVAASVALVWIVIRPQSKPAPKTVEVANVAAVAPTAVSQKPSITPKRAVRRTAKASYQVERLPKLQQFPAPSPLTAEEHALVAFVQHDPKEAEQIFAELHTQSNEPIEIQPIQIPPLQSDGGQ